MRGAPLTDKTTAEWLEILQSTDLAAMPCHTLQTLPQDPHLKAVGLIDFEEHPTEGNVAAIRPTLRVDGDVPVAGVPAAPRGWHTRDILTELGYNAAEINTFIKEGSAYTHES